MITTFLAVVLQAAPAAEPVGTAQGVEYRIEASLDEPTDVLRGRAELRYTNRATVALDTLWFHQHLNAFRPQSAWARRDLEFGNRRFEDLGPDDHAYERFTSVQVDGGVVMPIYPLSPDSTVVAIPLRRSLGPGETVTVRMDWEARLSTTPRRQGRRGRHYDFAQWYPRIAVRNEQGWHWQPLLPQGEFFGEFGRYDVTLEVAEDQVIGATGVPVEGDPGWSSAARTGYDDILAHRGFYGDAGDGGLGLLTGSPPAGRKRVRWLADDVHHFGWSIDPEYVYEGGRVARTGPTGGEIGVHILYWPSDIDWADGAALRRTVRTLEWLQEMFGPYPWPQLTNLHRLESGGTEFPMMMMNGSPSEGLIMHEGVHQYLHGILANNEFDEGWLDEGFTSFITDWYFEENGVSDVWDASMAGIVSWEAAGATQPIAMPAAEFVNSNTYSAMTYTKTSLVLRMLRWLIGEDQMRAALRTFYDRYAMRHVNEAAFRIVVNDVTGEDLNWFFDQWLHTTDQLDYSIASATTTRASDGQWLTRLEVRRAGEAWMPVTLRVTDVEQRLTSRDRVQIVEIRTSERPDTARVDPDVVLIDVNPANNAVAVVER